MAKNHRPIGQSINALTDAALVGVEQVGEISAAAVERLGEGVVKLINIKKKKRKNGG